MKIKIINSDGTRELKELPESWGDVTWNQMAQLRKGKHFAEVFTGVPLEFWQNKQATKSYIELNQLLSWSLSTPDWNPSDFKMVLKEKEINFKNVKLQLESIGQYLDAEHSITEFRKKNGKDTELVKVYPVIIAIYADKEMNGSYDYFRAMDLVDEIKRQPYQKVNNIGGFFLTNMPTLVRGGNLMHLLWNMGKRKLRRVFYSSMLSIKVMPH